MRGFPKTIATKRDIENLMSLYPEQTKAHLQRLLDGRFVWQKTAVLKGNDIGVTDATHEVITQENDGVIERIQMELIEDPNCALFRLGLTKEEAEGLLGKK